MYLLSIRNIIISYNVHSELSYTYLLDEFYLKPILLNPVTQFIIKKESKIPVINIKFSSFSWYRYFGRHIITLLKELYSSLNCQGLSQWTTINY
jgi:hypothetical protein